MSKTAMTDTEIGLIEEALGIFLPEHYSETIKSLPLDKLENQNLMLSRDPKSLISWNKEYMQSGYYGREWPDSLFVIGSDGCGGIYFINLESEDTRVFYASWENDPNFSDLSALRYQDDLQSFYDRILQLEEEYGC